MNERKIHWRSLERERGGVRRGPSVQTPEAFVGRAGVTGVPPGRAGGWGSCGQAGGRAGGAGNRGGGQYRRLPAPLPPGTPARLVESPGPALETSFFFFFCPGNFCGVFQPGCARGAFQPRFQNSPSWAAQPCSPWMPPHAPQTPGCCQLGECQKRGAGTPAPSPGPQPLGSHPPGRG